MEGSGGFISRLKRVNGENAGKRKEGGWGEGLKETGPKVATAGREEEKQVGACRNRKRQTRVDWRVSDLKTEPAPNQTSQSKSEYSSVRGDGRRSGVGVEWSERSSKEKQPRRTDGGHQDRGGSAGENARPLHAAVYSRENEERKEGWKKRNVLSLILFSADWGGRGEGRVRVGCGGFQCAWRAARERRGQRAVVLILSFSLAPNGVFSEGR